MRALMTAWDLYENATQLYPTTHLKPHIAYVDSFGQRIFSKRIFRHIFVAYSSIVIKNYSKEQTLTVHGGICIVVIGNKDKLLKEVGVEGPCPIKEFQKKERRHGHKFRRNLQILIQKRISGQ